MDQLKKLIELRQAQLDEMNTLITTAETEKRSFTEAEDTRLAEIRAAIAKTDKDIERLKFLDEQRQKQEALNKDLEQAGIRRHYHTGDDLQQNSKDDEETFKRFSFIKFLRDASSPGGLEGVELEMHQEAKIEARNNKLEIRNFGIPAALLRKPPERRAMTAGTAGQGGHTVATELRGFIDALRARLVFSQLGAQFLGGLIGNVAFPRQITKSTPTEAAENATAGDESITFDQVTLSPKRLPATADISKQLLLQSSNDVERLVIDDLIKEMRRRMEAMAINGSGASNEPLGILNVTGIGDVAGGVNGLAPTRTHLVNIKKEVAIDDAEMGRVGFLSNEDVKAKLQTTAVDAGSGLFVWPDTSNTLVGYQATTTSLVPNNLDKGTSTGVCSAIIFANWEDLLIAQWGGLDILVDIYSKAGDGLVKVVADTYYDIAVRHAESFSAMQDALTA